MVPSISLSWPQTIPIAILTASLLGSSHCVAMCGGLMLNVAKSRKTLFLYHFGRLFGYCSLGALAGLIGETFLESTQFLFIPKLSATLIALGFVFTGVQLWQGKSIHLFRLPFYFWNKLANCGSFSVGLLSAFLPCGWLHIFILGAIGTSSTKSGCLLLFFFWLGTLPSMTFAPWIIQRIFKPLTNRLPRLSAIILIVIGIGNLGVKLIPANDAKKTCHSKKSSFQIFNSNLSFLKKFQI